MNKDNKNKAMALSDDELEQAAGGFSIETIKKFGGQTIFNLKNDGGKTLGTYNSMGDAKSAGADTGEAYKKGNDRTITQELNNKFFNITKF